MKKYFLTLFLLVSFIAVAGLSYIELVLPDLGPIPEVRVLGTTDQVERGKYLANHVTVCMDCHSNRDWSLFAGPLVVGTEGIGGELFSRDFGFPGNFYSKNITPAALKDWTDGELYRAITMGVTKSGEAIFPVMPHKRYGLMHDDDIHAIIAYVRTLKPQTSEIPEREIDFPMNFIINTIPELNAPAKVIPAKNTVEYGQYLFNAAACGDCHTKQEQGQPIEGMEYAGGFEFKIGNTAIVRSANITPDKETGIGHWTKEQFIERFKVYADSAYQAKKIEPNQFNTVMPWTMYSGISKEDLGVMYDYIMTLKPIKNNVVRFEN
ncbi:MAG: c-type cytochrome [Cytophagaceae bacterium]